MLLGLSAAALGYVLLVATYRLYFHPINKFPGPKLAAVTSLYGFYFNVVKGGRYLWEIEKMHKKYGAIVLSHEATSAKHLFSQVLSSELIPTRSTSRTLIFTRKYMRQNYVTKTPSSLD